MGNVQFPAESELANSTRHQAYIELHYHELFQTVKLLKCALKDLQAHESPSSSPRFNAPAPGKPDLKYRPALTNIPTPFQSISNVSTSSVQVISIPKPFPYPIGIPKESFTSQASAPRHCHPIQNSRPAIANTGTPGHYEIQGAVSGSGTNHARVQLGQLNITGKTSPGLGESRDKIVELKEARESWGQGEVNSAVSRLMPLPEQLSAWRRRFTTPVTKHNRNSITAMCYVPSFEEFKGSDDNTGWLISSSEKLLNLWECTSRCSVSESSLQVMSFQQTEFVMEEMIVDFDAKFLCAFCPHPREKDLCITMHTIGGPAIFKYQGMIRIPCEDSSRCTNQSLDGGKMLHLASLRTMGVGNYVVVALDRNMCVYDLSSMSANPSTTVPPKTLWEAHDSPISCMQFNSSVHALITGTEDGCIRLWDMKAKACNPVRQYLQKKWITCIEMVDGTTMCSSSLDGTIGLWDIRYSSSPYMSVISDEKPILKMDSLQMHNTVAFTTTGGLFCLEIPSSKSMNDDAASRYSSSRSTISMSASSHLWTLTPLPSKGPSTGIKWNTRSCTEIYTSQPDGSIAVFAK